MATSLFSSKRQPGVGINQLIVAGGAIVSESALLPGVLIGIKNNIITDSRASTSYVTGDDNSIDFPEFETGAKIYADSVEIVAKNIVFAIKDSEEDQIYPSSSTNVATVERTTGTGTISNSSSGTTITGVGTTFLKDFKIGDTIVIDPGRYYEETVTISAIASNTSMTTGTITNAHSGVAYKLPIHSTLTSGYSTVVITASGPNSGDVITGNVYRLVLTSTKISDRSKIVTTIAQNFDTDNATTAGAVRTSILTNAGVATDTLSGSNRIHTIVAAAGYMLMVTKEIVTGGASQATLTVTGTEATTFTDDVNVNDSIAITHTTIGTVRVKVKSVPSDINVILDTGLPSGLNTLGINYATFRHPGEIGSSDTDILIDDTTANAFEDTFPGDEVAITHPTQGNITASIDKVISTSQVKLDKHLLSSTNIQYSITRSNSTFTTILSSITGSFNPVNLATSTDILKNNDPDSDFADVQVGDNVRIIEGGVIITNASVVGIVDINNIQLNKSYNTGTVIFTITRTQEANAPYDLTVNTDFDLSDTDDDGYLDNSIATLHASIDINSVVIKSADIYITYKALSTKNANKVLTIASDEEILEKAGVNSVENPMGSAAVVLAGNTTKKFNIIPIEADTNIGWLNALSASENYRLYSLVMLTQNSTYQSYGKTNVDGMSTLLKAKWRTLWANLEHIYESVVTPLKTGGILTYHNAALPDHPDPYLTLYDPVADFTNAQIDGFAKVIFVEDDETEVSKFFKVTAKVNKSTIELENFYYAPPSGVAEGKGSYIQGTEITTGTNIIGTGDSPIDVTYKVFYLAEKAEQAQLMATRAHSYSDRRVNLVSNETCIITINGEDYEVPGYYICAAYAGISQETEPHQGLTNFPIAGIKGVRKGIEYFSSEDLGVMAAGGNWIVIQDIPDETLPYAWMQSTTDTTDVKRNAYNFTKNLDETSYALYDDMKKFPGNNNLVPEAFDPALAQLTATMEKRYNNIAESPTGGKLGRQHSKPAEFNGFTQDPFAINRTFSELRVFIPVEWDYLDIDIIA